MKAIILYSTLHPDRIHSYTPYYTTEGPIFIRHEIVECGSLVDALGMAEPVSGETVLNTISAPTE